MTCKVKISKLPFPSANILHKEMGGEFLTVFGPRAITDSHQPNVFHSNVVREVIILILPYLWLCRLP